MEKKDVFFFCNLCNKLFTHDDCLVSELIDKKHHLENKKYPSESILNQLKEGFHNQPERLNPEARKGCDSLNIMVT